jgi:DNA-binding IclR family transcriptional regulator
VRDILDLFTLEEPELDIKQIRAAAGLPPSTLARLVRNLVSDGLLQQHGDRYRIGAAVIRWAAVAQCGLSVTAIITPLLDELRDETGETAGFFVRDRGFRVCAALAETRQAIGRRLTLGQAVPAHAGSPGKVLLAFDPRALGEIDLARLEPLTGRTIHQAGQLQAELEKIRTEGYATSYGEWDQDVAGCAAPVFGAARDLLGAIGIGAPMSRVTDTTAATWTTAVKRIAAKATAQLSGMPR